MLRTVPETVTLNNGVEMPSLGLGTYKADEGGEVEQAIRWALELGYRSIDTASAYGNEEGVGRAIQGSNVPREEIFLTSKLWNDDQGYDSTLKAFRQSLDRLDMEYVDLYLVHWPIPELIDETWRAMEKIYEDGLARAVGVSNFLEQHLLDLFQNAEVRPTVNQIEFHPHLQQPELVEFCQEQDVQVEAWSPLMKGEVFDLPELQEIGQRHGKSAGQVEIRWQLQRGLVTIPKSVKFEHLEANLQVFDFELTEDEMQKINALDRNRRIGPNPTTFAT